MKRHGMMLLGFMATAGMTLPASGLTQPVAGDEGKPRYRANYAVEGSWSGNSSMDEGGKAAGETDAWQTRVSYVGAFSTSATYSILAGLEGEVWKFDDVGSALFPAELGSAAVLLGNLWQFREKWSLQTTLAPGIYSDWEDLGGDDFNVPATIILGYQLNPDLLLVGGLGINIWSEYPVMGGVGVKWKFHQDWTLNFVFPKPRLEYQICPDAKLFAGAELKGNAYRVAEDFGTRRGMPALDGETLTYREIRVGGGMECKLWGGIRAVVEGGWMVDRRFVYDDRNVELDGDGAPYAQIALIGRY